MVSIERFRTMALSFAGTSEQPHFEKVSFRVKKKIFVTLSIEKQELVLKLSLVDQSVFCSIDSAIIYPVAGAWGTRGWTGVDLKKVKKDILNELLQLAYLQIA